MDYNSSNAADFTFASFVKHCNQVMLDNLTFTPEKDDFGRDVVVARFGDNRECTLSYSSCGTLGGDSLMLLDNSAFKRPVPCDIPDTKLVQVITPEGDMLLEMLHVHEHIVYRGVVSHWGAVSR